MRWRVYWIGCEGNTYSYKYKGVRVPPGPPDMRFGVFGKRFLVCIGTPFGLYRYPFWFESDREGAFFRFLCLFGLFFTGGCLTPPPPSLYVGLSSLVSGGQGSECWHVTDGFGGNTRPFW